MVETRFSNVVLSFSKCCKMKEGETVLGSSLIILPPPKKNTLMSFSPNNFGQRLFDTFELNF